MSAADPDISAFPFTAPTIDTLGSLIKKPTLKAKLLGKPPFRFLHDITTSLMQTCGFPPPALYDPSQLNSENVKEKEEKLEFLKRLIKFTSMAVGRDIPCNPSKIISGLEPENTNLLLQQMASAAINIKSININQLLAKMDGKAPVPSATSSPSPPPPAAAASSSSSGAMGQQQQRAAPNANAEQKKKEEDTRKPNTDKPTPAPSPLSPTATTTGARSTSSTSSSSSSTMKRSSTSSSSSPSRPVIALPDISNETEFWSITATLLSTLIQKPKMAEKLLRKPPFRYLHDIVTALIHDVGFPPTALFSPEELNSENFKETNDKLNFLRKLIDFLQACTGTDLSHVNPKKIAAGLEPEATNLMLQTLARAAASGINGTEFLNNGGGGGGGASASPAPVSKPTATTTAAPAAAAAAAQPKPVSEPAQAAKRPSGGGGGGEEDGIRAGMPKPGQPVMPKLALGDIEKKGGADDDDGFKPVNAISGGDDHSSGMGIPTGSGDAPATRMARPKTARRAPPKLKSNLVDDKAKADQEMAETKTLATGVITEDDKTAEEEPVEEEDDNTRGGGGGGGGGDKDDFAEKLAGLESATNKNNAGKLVRDMIQASEAGAGGGGSDGKMKLQAAAVRSSSSNPLGSSAAISELREAIQKLCQSANPLGKCIDFVYDDIDAMNKEMSRWRSQYQQYTTKLEAERQDTEAKLEPLTLKLAEAEAAITEQQKKLHALKAQILRNDQTILQLLEHKSAID